MLLKDQMEKQGMWLFQYRGILPLIILGFGFYEYLQTELHPELYILGIRSHKVWYEMSCLLLSHLGLVVRIIAVGHSASNTSGRNKKAQVADRLNTTGLYSIVRNPLYLGNFLMWFGISLLTMNAWFIIAFLLVYWLYYERIIYAEEQYLTRKFGKEYEDWAAKTPCFIPRLKGYRKADLPFSWKKVVRKEKNGLLALLLVFALFDILGGWIVGEPPKYIPLQIATGAVLVAYVILKSMKKYTNLLKETAR